MLNTFQKTYEPVLKKEIIGPIFIVIISFLIYRILISITKRIFKIKQSRVDDRKMRTIVSLVNNIFKYLIVIIAILMILDIYGIQTSGLLASLGIVGVVAGLAVQDILKDILSGSSIIMENQYAVGDIVSIGNFKGEVISLGLRITKIKALTGEVKIISNRNITEVINYSLEKSLAIVNIPISYKEDVDKVEKILNDLCLDLKSKNKLISGNISCIGITSFDSSSINFRVTAETVPTKQYDVERFLLKEIKIKLDKEQIEIPFDQVVIHNA